MESHHAGHASTRGPITGWRFVTARRLRLLAALSLSLALPFSLLVNTTGSAQAGASSVRSAIIAHATAWDQSNAAYTELPDGSNCNAFTNYWHRGVHRGCPPGSRSEEWCADFAQWVWQNSGVNTFGITAWVFTFVDWGRHTGRFKKGAWAPVQPGDVVIWGNLQAHYGAHVAIVDQVSNGQLLVTGGNDGPNTDRVWTYWMNPVTSTAQGYPVIGYVSPN